MILYLSAAQHSNLLDFIGLYDRDSATIKKMVGSFVLKQFIIYDMRNFSHFAEVVLDRPAFGDRDAEFAETIEEFLTMYSARVTVICEGLTESDSLFAALLNSGVGNIVCDTKIVAMQREISECLSDTGMTSYNTKERAKPKNGKEHDSFTCENINIAILSSQSRMGATTAAMGLTKWLHSVGRQSAMRRQIPADTSPLLREHTKWSRPRTAIAMTEWITAPDSGMNFIILDMGTNLQAQALSKRTAVSVTITVGRAVIPTMIVPSITRIT